MKWTEAYEHSGWTIAVPVKLIHAIGAKGAILVAQLFYWSGKQLAEDGWIYKTQADLEQETGLSRHEQNKCVEDLKRKNVLETRYERLDHRLYYKINKEALDDIMEADLPSQLRKTDLAKSHTLPSEIRKTDLGKSDNRMSRNPKSGDGEIRQSEFVINQRLLSENTTEKTTTTRPPDLFTNGHTAERAGVVVALSSVAGEGDEPRDIVDKLTEEFGLSISQGREVETFLESKGQGYVIEKAGIVRAKKSVNNLAGAFMKALGDDWKAPRTSSPSAVKRPRAVEPVEELTNELVAKKELGNIKAILRG